MPSSKPWARIASSVARASSRGDDSSISTYQGCLPASGSRMSMPWRTLKSTAMSASSSKLVSAARGLVLRDRQQLQRVVRRFQADEGGLHRARLRKQFQRRRGDDAERAFGADEQVAQIVAGIVLLQLRQPVQNAAVGQHHFEPERHLARHAIGQRGGAAGIGGEIAADGAASLRAERQRKQPVDLGGALLRDLQHHAGLAGHGVGRRCRCRGSCPSAAARPRPRR